MCTHISSTYSIVSQRTKNNYNSVTKWKKYNNKVFIQLNDMCHVVLVVSHMRFLQKNDLGSIKLTGRHLHWSWLAILLIQLTKLFLIALFILVCLKAKTKHSFQSTGTRFVKSKNKNLRISPYTANLKKNKKNSHNYVWEAMGRSDKAIT